MGLNYDCGVYPYQRETVRTKHTSHPVPIFISVNRQMLSSYLRCTTKVSFDYKVGPKAVTPGVTGIEQLTLSETKDTKLWPLESDRTVAELLRLKLLHV